MQGSLTYNDKEKKYDQTISGYQPSQEIKELYLKCRESFDNGEEIMNRSFEEFNGLSVVGRMNEDQMTWLNWTPAPSGDPESDWRWNGVRPLTRNKVLSTAAHATQATLVPQVFAQNDNDEEDRDASYVARSLLEYNINKGDYPVTFFYGVVSGLVNPVTYWEVEYTQAYQEIIEGTSSEFTKKKVVDDILSGFQNHLRPADEILISNPYQFDIQKQKALVKKRMISYDEAEALHGSHENFGHVQAGKSVVMGEDGNFYDVEDVNSDMVQECTFYYRREDLQVTFIGGIYLGSNNTKFNPFSHRTTKNKPKYGFAKFGAEPIDAKRFFYYKSLVAKMQNDQEAIDREWQMYFDATFLATFPPIAGYGTGKIDRSVVVPATVNTFDKDAKMEPINVANPMAAAAALREAENAMNESSQDPQLGGIQDGTQKTKGESLLLQQNAETNLGPITKMVGQMVKEVGEMMLQDIVRYQTIGEMTEILGGLPKMKFKTFILPNKTKNGKNVTEYIRFTDRFAGKEYSEEEKEMEELAMFEEHGDEKHVYDVNPSMFARLDWLVSVDYEQLMKRNTAFERAFKLEIYDRAIANPYVDQNLITRDFLLEPLVKGEASKYQKNMEAVMPGILPEQGGGQDSIPGRMVKSAAMDSVGMNY